MRERKDCFVEGREVQGDKSYVNQTISINVTMQEYESINFHHHFNDFGKNCDQSSDSTSSKSSILLLARNNLDL